MSLVVDASIAVTWCFSDERTPATTAVLNRVVEEAALAPSIWPIEVLNALAIAQRRGRCNAADRLRLTGFLRQLPIAIDEDTLHHAWTTTAELADRFRLTMYDAAYLELAHRQSLPLATLDSDLQRAAKAAGVSLLGMPS
jgi:predicted nucleic acid-binding protein